MSTVGEPKRVLNVGGNSKEIPLPPEFADFEHLMLDIDPDAKPDICCDAREMQSLEIGQFDAVYCSHNLEHYYRHDVKTVLMGFLHVLKPGGFVYAVVPDLMEVMQYTVKNGLDIDDVLYTSPAGPIMVLDVLYGYSAEIERRGIDFFAHKTGYSKKSLSAAMKRAGFSIVYSKAENLAITAIAFKETPNPEHLRLFSLPAHK
jgi:ubiquinone/menaquinone biosynthesis C-methylase UbiE